MYLISRLNPFFFMFVSNEFIHLLHVPVLQIYFSAGSIVTLLRASYLNPARVGSRTLSTALQQW